MDIHFDFLATVDALAILTRARWQCVDDADDAGFDVLLRASEHLGGPIVSLVINTQYGRRGK